MGQVLVRASRRAKAYTRTSKGFAVTSVNKKFGRSIEAKGLTRRDATILRGRLRKGESKGTLPGHKSTFFIKPYFGKK